MASPIYQCGSTARINRETYFFSSADGLMSTPVDDPDQVPPAPARVVSLLLLLPLDVWRLAQTPFPPESLIHLIGDALPLG